MASKNHNKYRKDKPWDNEETDHWKNDDWSPDDLKGGSLLEESSFATLFPKYREKYLREVWPLVTKALEVICHSSKISYLRISLLTPFCRHMEWHAS